MQIPVRYGDRLHDTLARGSEVTATTKDGVPLTLSRLSSRVRPVLETLPELFVWKRSLAPRLGRTPYVDGEAPVVCAWYPSARAVVLWNLSDQRQDLMLRQADTVRSVPVDGLDIALIEGIDP